MIKIALVAESKNDASSLKNLLGQKYDQFVFTHIAKNRKGSQLDSDKLKKELKAEFGVGAFKYWIFIRDLDDFKSNWGKIRIKHKWFDELNQITKNKGIFLLNIYELEALILSDIECFNRIFRAKIKYSGDPMNCKEPKEFLMKKTKSISKKYTESDCPEIFKQLDIKTVAKNCKYFKEFLAELDLKLKRKKAA
jgi:hypothetical protein